MGEGIKLGGGTSKIVNGIVEEYLAETEEINANTFVEFVNKANMEFVAYEQKSLGVTTLCAEKLNSNTVLVCQIKNIIAIKIENGVISIGTKYTANGGSGIVSGVVVPLTEDTALWIGNESSYGNIATIKITGTTITTLKAGSYFSNWATTVCACKLNENLVVARTGRNYVAIAISEDGTPSAGTVLQLTSPFTHDSYSRRCLLPIGDNSCIALAVKYGDGIHAYSYQLAFVHLSVTDKVITIENTYSTGVPSPGTSNACALLGKLDDNRFITSVTYIGSTPTGYIGNPTLAFVTEIGEDVVTIGTPYYICNSSLQTPELVILNHETAIFGVSFYEASSTMHHGIIPASVVGFEIIPGAFCEMTEVKYAMNSLCVLDDCIVPSSSVYVGAYSVLASKAIKEAKEKVHGFTTSKATTTSLGKVMVLNTGV